MSNAENRSKCERVSGKAPSAGSSDFRAPMKSPQLLRFPETRISSTAEANWQTIESIGPPNVKSHPRHGKHSADSDRRPSHSPNLHPLPLPKRFQKFAGLVSQNVKLIIPSATDQSVNQLYDLSTDPTESNNLARQQPERVRRMRDEFMQFLKSARISHCGDEYDSNDYTPVDGLQNTLTVK